MDRSTIDAVVRKYLARALDLDPDGIDTSLTMKDLGANSLDIVEIVASSMRELRIRIGRDDLDKIPHIDGLVDALWAKAQEAK